MSLSILPVTNRNHRSAFYNFAWRVYKNDPNWVPHLWPQRLAYLEQKAAFFQYGEGEFWLALRGKEVVGTIGTAINHSRNHDRKEQVGIFGFFEVLPNDYEVAQCMWDHACAFTKSHGLSELQGPYSFAMNDENGFLIEGHQYLPTIMMGHSPPYYAQFAERYGFEKLQDSLAYRFDLKQINFDVAQGPQVIHRIAERAARRLGSNVVRCADARNWDDEVIRLHALYNKSLAVLPEFSPLELVEFQTQANSLRPILDPELVFIAEVNGRAVGFALGLPNIMEALKYAHGLQYPWNYLQLAWAKKKITGVSFKILAIDPDYWGYGLESLMFLEMGKTIIRKRYTWIDGSLTSESNPQTNKIASRLGAYVYRKYREYRLTI